MRLLGAFAVWMMCLCGVCAAQTQTVEVAQQAAARLERAAALLEAASTRSDRVAALTETVQAYEDGLAAVRDGLRRVAIGRQAIEADLAARSEEISALLGVLQTMGNAPAPVLLLHPSGPLGTARAGMMAADVTAAIELEAAALRARLEEARVLEDLQQDAAAVLQEGLDGARAAREQLSAAIADRTELPRRFIEDPERTAELIASTDTLEAFAGGLAGIALEELAVSVPDASAQRGTLALPVEGTILREFGEPDAAGIARPGLIIATRPRALVTAPVAATLRFRGPLLDYGNVVIIEPAPDVLIVLAGLAEVFGETGEIVPAGAPLGLMGGEQPTARAILTESGAGVGGQRTQTLYLEVRDGQSVADPDDWFAVDR